MEERLNRIKELIKNKNLRMNPVIKEEKIINFELKHNITIPTEYREFLMKVGNGGDGPPDYNLYDLDSGYKELQECNKGNTHFLVDQFSLTENWVWEAEPNWTKEVEDKVIGAYHGVLFLGTDGCGLYWALIINGQCRGEVWNIADVGAGPCAPKLTFLEWYEYWLGGGSDWFRDFVYVKKED